MHTLHITLSTSYCWGCDAVRVIYRKTKGSVSPIATAWYRGHSLSPYDIYWRPTAFDLFDACKGRIVMSCYFHTLKKQCYGIWGDSQFRHTQNYRRQRLRIMEDFTLFWVPYIARDPFTPRAVMARHTANGDVVYVTKFYDIQNHSLAGHYLGGAERTTSVYGRSVYG